MKTRGRIEKRSSGSTVARRLAVRAARCPVVLVFLSALAGCGPGSDAARDPAPQNAVSATKHPQAPTDAAKRQTSLTIAAAADLKFALDEIIKQFSHAHPDIKVQPAYGSSGTFFAQISNGAPFDMYFSADVEYPRRLIQKKLAIAESEFLYAVGRLVVWVPRRSRLDLDKLGVQALRDPSVRKIAIANPQHAPYGRAAEAAMKKSRVYDHVRERLVYGESVAQAAQFAETGAADVGIIALSLAMAAPLKDEGRFWELPLDAYPRIDQGGVILARAKDIDAAQSFRAFLLGREAKAVLRRYGFFLPGD